MSQPLDVIRVSPYCVGTDNSLSVPISLQLLHYEVVLHTNGAVRLQYTEVNVSAGCKFCF